MTRSEESPFQAPSRNLGTATFSSLAKRAEELVHGENSLIFDSYNNAIILRSARLNPNVCLSFEVLTQAIKNVSRILFSNGTVLTGISDGYVPDGQGGLTPIYDSTIALSTAFGYELSQASEAIRKDLNVEIERRIQDSIILTEKLQQTSEDCEAAVRMVHYIDYDTENMAMAFVIPYPDPEGNPGYLDAMPAETIYVDGESYLDPDTGVREAEPIGTSERTVAIVNADGLYVDGHIVMSFGNTLQFPAVEIPTEEGVVPLPKGIIFGVTPTLEFPFDELLPSAYAVADGLNTLRQLVDADLQNHAMLIAMNTEWIESLVNSTGGLEKEDFDPDKEEWWTRPIWLYIKRWIQQGIYDNLNNKHQQDDKYWNLISESNCLYRKFEAWKKDYNLEKSAALAKYCKTEVSDITATQHLYIHRFDGDENYHQRFVVADSYTSQTGYYALDASGVYTENWLWIGDSTAGKPDRNKKFNFLCAGTSRFETSIQFGPEATIEYVTIENNEEDKDKEVVHTTSMVSIMDRISKVEAAVSQWTDPSARIAELEAKVARLEKLLAHFVDV